MVVTFLAPVLLALGMVRCAGPGYYLGAALTVVPFVMIPVAIGSLVTLFLVNVFPARRTRDILMIMGLLFAVAVVLLLRFIRPERLLSVQSLPDVAAFFSLLQSPVTPLLPSFWAGETLFGALQGRADWLHLGALWTTALALTVVARMTYGRHYFAGWSRAQEARKVRFTRLRFVERVLGVTPLRPPARSLLTKDVKVFLRDTSQWSQLLLLLALVVVYVYNFRVLDLERIPGMGPMLKNTYAFVNLGLAAFVLSAVAVRFIFPAVSAEGRAFWILRTSPVSLRSFLWSKFWTGLLPVLVLAEALTVVSNEFLGPDPFLKIVGAAGIFFLSFALVGMAAGLGARYPRFAHESLTQVAGSFGGIAFMILAVLLILVEIGLLAWPSSVYLMHRFRKTPIPPPHQMAMAACFLAALLLCVLASWLPMRRGARALEELGR
jgi:ABC-2 type transport system permease protein